MAFYHLLFALCAFVLFKRGVMGGGGGGTNPEAREIICSDLET